MTAQDPGENLEEFRRGFREEAREIVMDLEASLLALSSARGDRELVGRVFRALHTIKGSGAMFGFDALAAFTHRLETAFDEVRQGRVELSAEMIDHTLGALDQIRSMIEADPAAGQAEEARGADILRQLQACTASGPAAAPLPASAAQRDWQIRFAPGPDLLRSGADPLLLLRQLRQMGELRATASAAQIPFLAELDPVRCYVSWTMTLRSSADENAIRDVFIFVEDRCDLTIEAAAEAPAPCDADRIAQGLQERRRSPGRREYDQPDNAGSLRVPAARLDQLVNLIGELVTVQARLAAIAGHSDDPAVIAASEEIERLTSALRDISMSIRMLPIRGTFERFRRLVHDLARDLGKQVELTMSGSETELDKTVIDQLGDPLMHLIRNSMDHGIESPEARAAAGKPATASIHLAARHAGANVVVEVSDDGAGIDTEAVHRRAIERGLAAPDAALPESEILSFIFQPGFSTARQVTDLSGRGVGMDVVRQRIESLHGHVEISSRRGSGTTIALRLPLTLAIIDGLLVRIDQSCFVLPLASTLECVELDRRDAEASGKAHLTHVRGELLPWIRLREYFGTPTPPPEREQIMVVSSELGRCGLVVDQVLGNCQAVIRNLGRFYRNVQIVSGATILGDGSVALILDPHRLVQEARRAQGTSPSRAGGRAGSRRTASRAAPPADRSEPERIRAGSAEGVGDTAIGTIPPAGEHGRTAPALTGERNEMVL